MTELTEREGTGERSPVIRGPRPLGERIVGAGMLGAIVASVFMLVIAMTNPFVPFVFSLVFVAAAFVCGMATPSALGLLRGNAPEPRRELASRTLRRAKAGLENPGAATRRDAGRAERQLLEAIERHGEITPARAALETALTVAEADRMLGELAQKGYLEVHAREGRIFYSL